MSGKTALRAIGTAVPAHRISQERVQQFMLECHPPDAALRRRLRSVYKRSQIEFRHTCCPDFAIGGAKALYAGAEPSTAQRMR